MTLDVKLILSVVNECEITERSYTIHVKFSQCQPGSSVTTRRNFLRLCLLSFLKNFCLKFLGVQIL